MNPRAHLERWWNAPWWARYPALYAALTLLSIALGWPTIGIGNAMFLAGATLILTSLLYVRTGGTRKIVVERDRTGRPRRELLPAQRREQEIQRGIGLFLTGLALWAPLAMQAMR